MYISADEVTGRFTFDAEGSTNPASPYFLGKPCHPSTGSGVTIGAGYDMGGRTEAGVKADLLAAGVSSDVAGKLAKGAGKTGKPADQFVSENSQLLIKDVEVLRRLFESIYPGYVSQAQQNVAFHANTFSMSMKTYGAKYANAVLFDWDDLYPAMRVMATDFVYQGFGRQQSGYGKPLHFCMANDFDWLIDYITKSPAISQYEAGRGRARYLRSRKNIEMSACSQSINASVPLVN